MRVSYYLDTARLGIMSPTARDDVREFVALASVEGASARMERFFYDGNPVDGAGSDAKFHWHGLSQARDRLVEALGCSISHRLYFCETSGPLVQAAATFVFRSARRLLTTDLDWPRYRRVFEREARHRGGEILTLPMLDALRNHNIRSDLEFVDRFLEFFDRHECDSVYLTAISHHGLRLPVTSLINQIRQRTSVRHVVVDGAQEFGQGDVPCSAMASTIYLCGGHKWLGTYVPISVACCGQTRAKRAFPSMLTELLGRQDLHSPLLELSAKGATDDTLNAIPLVACNGALADFSRACASEQTWHNFEPEGWRPLSPKAPFRSKIHLLRSWRHYHEGTPPEALRLRLLSRGIAATCYEGGLARLSFKGLYSDDDLGDIAERMSTV